jgi:hypothetical protein
VLAAFTVLLLRRWDKLTVVACFKYSAYGKINPSAWERTVTLCSGGKLGRAWTWTAERILTARLLIHGSILAKLFNGSVQQNVVQNEGKGWIKYATSLSAVQTSKVQWLLYIPPILIFRNSARFPNIVLFFSIIRINNYYFRKSIARLVFVIEP